MGNLLKYLLIIVVLGLWIYIVGRSCNTSKKDLTSTTTTVDTPSDAGDDINDEADLEDLYEVDENDVAAGDADASNADNSIDKSPEDAASLSDGGSSNGKTSDEDNAGSADSDSKNNIEKASGSSTSGSYSGRSNGSTFGKYLVVTGSYLSEANAKVMVKKLTRLGYDASEVLSFDLSQYYSVTAGRYSDLGEARAVAKRIKSKGMEAYVHKMRGKKVK